MTMLELKQIFKQLRGSYWKNGSEILDNLAARQDVRDLLTKHGWL